MNKLKEKCCKLFKGHNYIKIGEEYNGTAYRCSYCGKIKIVPRSKSNHILNNAS